MNPFMFPQEDSEALRQPNTKLEEYKSAGFTESDNTPRSYTPKRFSYDSTPIKRTSNLSDGMSEKLKIKKLEQEMVQLKIDHAAQIEALTNKLQSESKQKAHLLVKLRAEFDETKQFC